MDRKILRIAGDTAESHEEFGVVDPLAAKLNSKSTGVGTRVIMTDADDKSLVDMIIGKAVKDTEAALRPPQQPGRGLRRGARPDEAVDDFADWIEDDLLKLKAMDLRKSSSTTTRPT